MKGLQLRKTVMNSGVPIYSGASHLAAHGEGKLSSLSFTSAGRDITLDADVVALHEGVIPNTQLSRLVDAEHRWNDVQRCFHPVTDQWGETTEPGVYVTGDGGGIAGGLAAERSGTITGLAIARQAWPDGRQRPRPRRRGATPAPLHRQCHPRLSRPLLPRAVMDRRGGR